MTPRSCDVVLVDAVRSPVGIANTQGVLRRVSPADLLAQVLATLMDRVVMDSAEVEHLVTGSAGGRMPAWIPAIGRHASIGAARRAHVPSTSVDGAGGASTLALHSACQGILARAYDVMVAAGIESTHFTAYAPRAATHAAAAERMARRCGVTRHGMASYAERSRLRAREVTHAGEFHRELAPIRVSAGVGDDAVTVDELLCSPVETATRPLNPELDWHITGTTSAPLGEGAAALLIMSAQHANELGLVPRARIASFATVADHPDHVVPGPISATDVALKRAGISVDHLDHVEVNETHAAVPLAWLHATGINPEFVNPRGGALAMGDPRAVSGIRSITTMLTALEDTGGRFGMQAEWDPDGSASATVLERL